jgi:uncharacterized membrane protein YkvA (DUF1232 family)
VGGIFEEAEDLLRSFLASLLRGRRPLWILLAYLILPVDLLPDLLPGLGLADDATIAALLLAVMLRRRLSSQREPRGRVIDGHAADLRDRGDLGR